MATSATRQLYVQRILALYRCVPGTTGHLRRCDRQLAGQLYDRGIPLDVIRSAMILAVARRTFRSTDGPSLAAIATLHYFRPVIDEIIAEPLVPGYVDYLRHMLAAVAPEFVAASEHQISRTFNHQFL